MVSYSHLLSRGALALTLLAAAATSALAAPPQRSPEGPWAKSQLIVMPRAGVSAVDLDKALAPHGGKARALGRSGLQLVELPANASERSVQQRLARHPLLKFAELDRMVKIGATVNDPYAPNEWHLSTMNVPSAWDVSAGAGVVIAVLDTGSNAVADLKMVPGWNFYDNNSDSSDVHGHGTAVAGAAAAALNNGIGVAGIAGGASVMPLRVSDPTGWSSYSTIVTALNYAADKGAKVANISIGGVAGSSAIQTAAQYMKSKGGLVFVAAGNNSIDEGFTPTTSLIAVSAIDSTLTKASWSSWGNFVSLTAPGVAIWTTGRDGSFGAWSGTSFASPVSAGVAALAMSANPSLAPTDIEKALFSTAVDLGAAGRDSYYGYGLVNAGAAVTMARSMVSSVDTQAPSVAIVSPSAGATVSGTVAVDVSALDNVGVARVELRVNGALLATDTAGPYGFAWDTTRLANGSATLSATAYDAAGNVANAQSVGVTVDNPVVVDTTPPSVLITSPTTGSSLGLSATINATASDNASAVSQSLYIDGKLTTTVTGGSLSYKWNTRKVSAGVHTVQVVARDAAGNSSSSTVQVSK